jgi:hypothetical protein
MRFVSLSIALLVTACAASPDEVDGEHDDVLIDNGKGDTGGIREGSPEAKLVLLYANYVPEKQLVEYIELAPITARSIVEYRQQNLGPEDDRHIETLAELDSILFVGPIAFERLRAFAEPSLGPSEIGAPWTPEEPYEWLQCAQMHDRELATLLPPDGASVRRPFSWQLASRQRSCAEVNDCSEWEDAPLSLKTKTTPAIYPVPTKGTVEFERTAAGEYRFYLESPSSPVGFVCNRHFVSIWPDWQCHAYVNRDTSVPLAPPESLYYNARAVGYVCFDGRIHVTTNNYEHDWAIWGWL